MNDQGLCVETVAQPERQVAIKVGSYRQTTDYNH